MDVSPLVAVWMFAAGVLAAIELGLLRRADSPCEKRTERPKISVRGLRREVIIMADLDFLRRLCSDPLLCEHEAADGVQLAEPEPVAWVETSSAPARPVVPSYTLFARMPLPDGDSGWEEEGL